MNRTPLDDYLAEYLATAKRLGHTPKSTQLSSRVLSGLHRYDLSIHDAARACGLTPNTNKRAPEPLPEHMRTPEAKVVVFEAPQPAHALSPDELAAERAASLERQRKVREAEPRHRPLPYTGRERSRMWRIRSVWEEVEEVEP